MTKSLPHLATHVPRAAFQTGGCDHEHQLLLLLAVGRTAFLYNLPFAGDGKSFVGNVVIDRGAGSNKSLPGRLARAQSTCCWFR